MAREETEKQLYDAASDGDLPSFQRLLQGDRFLLDGVSFEGSRNLLHIATLCGQAVIVEEVLRILPRLARSLDSQNSTALHIAAAQGNLEITEKLMGQAPEMCWWRDWRGMNPIHVAAVNGHLEVLQKLIQHDSFPAMEKADRGNTVLHLCVKHRQRRVLEFLVGIFDHNYLDTKNDDGETILHLAANYNDIELIKYLVENTKIMRLSRDSSGRTALDIVRTSSLDDRIYEEMRELLWKWPNLPILNLESFIKFSDGMMVALALIASISFQAIINPPGGVWQDDSPTHKAGQAVWASTHPHKYKQFLRSTSFAFISSILAIFITAVMQTRREAWVWFGLLYIMTLVSFGYIFRSFSVATEVIGPKYSSFMDMEFTDFAPTLLVCFLMPYSMDPRIHLFIVRKFRRQTPPQTV